MSRRPLKHDRDLGLTLYGPTPATPKYRLSYTDPFTGERRQPREVLRAARVQGLAPTSVQDLGALMRNLVTLGWELRWIPSGHNPMQGVKYVAREGLRPVAVALGAPTVRALVTGRRRHSPLASWSGSRRTASAGRGRRCWRSTTVEKTGSCADLPIGPRLEWSSRPKRLGWSTPYRQRCGGQADRNRER